MNSVPETTAKTSERSPDQWDSKLLLPALLTALILILVWLLTKDPLVCARLQQFFRPKPKTTIVDYASLLKNDPHPGTHLPNTTASSAVQKATKNPRRGYLLINVGGCSTCMHTDFRLLEKQAEQYQLKLVMVTSANRSTATRFQRDAGARRSPIVCDPDGQLIAAMNAFFTPRMYYYSPDWRLQWIQKDPSRTNYNPFADPDFNRAMREVGENQNDS
jgi:hypothetical protein